MAYHIISCTECGYVWLFLQLRVKKNCHQLPWYVEHLTVSSQLLIEICDQMLYNCLLQLLSFSSFSHCRGQVAFERTGIDAAGCHCEAFPVVRLCFFN